MARIKYDIEGRSAIKAHKDLAKALKEVGAEADTTEKKLTKTERSARRIQESVDPAKRYNRQLKETARLAAQGAVSIEDAQRKSEQLRRRLDGVGKTGKSAFAGLAAQATGALGAVVSIGGAISLASSELRQLQQQAERRTQTQLSLAGAQAQLRTNLLPFEKSDRARFEQGLEKIATKNGIPTAAVFQAGAGNISATGNIDKSLELIGKASQLTRDPDQLRQLSGGLGDITTTTGISDPDAVLGFLATTAANSRVETFAQVGRQVGKVSGAFTSPEAGTDAETGAALFAAFTKGAADPTGEISRTAAIKSIDQFDNFFEKVSRREGFSATEADDFNEQLEILLGNRQLAAEFIKTGSFEAASKGAIEQLLLADGTVRQTFEQARAELKDKAALPLRAQELVEDVTSGPIQDIAKAEGVIRSQAEQFRLRPGASLSEESRENIIELRAALNRQSLTESRLSTFLETRTTLEREEAIELIRARLSFRAGRENQGFFLTPDEQAARQSLEGILETLLAIRDQGEAPNAANRNVTTRAE